MAESRRIWVFPVTRYAAFSMIALTLTVGGLLLWNLSVERREIRHDAYQQARSAILKDLLYRRWNSSHGGLYVPLSPATPPNPYLRGLPVQPTLQTKDDQTLTLVNPAYMTRQVLELQRQGGGLYSHLTSLHPLRPANAPDPWEASALARLEKGEKEVVAEENTPSGPILRVIRAIPTEPSCLRCHAAQGYRTGDVRGGLSVSVPLGPIHSGRQSDVIWIGHGLLWLLGITGVFWATRRVREQLRHRSEAEEKLRESEALHRLITDQIRDVVWILDVGTGQFRYMSPSIRRLCGITPETARNLKASSLLTAASFRRMRLSIPLRVRAAQKTGGRSRSYTDDLEVFRADGTTLWTETVSTCLVYPDGKVEVHGVTRDIEKRRKAENDLAESHAILDATIESAGVGILVLDHQQNVLATNTLLSRMWNLPPGWAEEGDPDTRLATLASRTADPSAFLAQARQWISSLPSPQRTLLTLSDGRYVDWSSSPFRQGRRVTGCLFTFQDVTEQEKNREELRAHRARLRAIFDNAAVGIDVVDNSGRFLEVNAHLAELLGYTQEELLRLSALELTHPDDLETSRTSLGMLVDEVAPHYQQEKRYIRKDGTTFWARLDVSPIPGPAGRPEAYVGIIADITEQRAYESRLKEMAAIDSLTGLPNRGHFFALAEREFERSMRYGTPLSAVMLDVDHFKQVNDTHGHLDGDTVLREVAARFRLAARSADILGRFGGEEFVALLPETSVDQAILFAERVRKAMESEPVPVTSGPITVTLSAGLADRASGIPDLDSLLDRADMALYRAKREGRNRSICHDV